MMSTVGNPLLRFSAECWSSVRRTFAGHLALYVCLAIFTPLTVAIAAAYRLPISFESSLFFLKTVPQFFIVGLFAAAVVQCFLLARRGSKRPLRDFGSWLHRATVSHDRP